MKIKNKKPVWASHIMRRSDNRRTIRAKEWQRKKHTSGQSKAEMKLEPLPERSEVHDHRREGGGGRLKWSLSCSGLIIADND